MGSIPISPLQTQTGAECDGLAPGVWDTVERFDSDAPESSRKKYQISDTKETLKHVERTIYHGPKTHYGRWPNGKALD